MLFGFELFFLLNLDGIGLILGFEDSFIIASSSQFVELLDPDVDQRFLVPFREDQRDDVIHQLEALCSSHSRTVNAFLQIDQHLVLIGCQACGCIVDISIELNCRGLALKLLELIPVLGRGLTQTQLLNDLVGVPRGLRSLVGGSDGISWLVVRIDPLTHKVLDRSVLIVSLERVDVLSEPLRRVSRNCTLTGQLLEHFQRGRRTSTSELRPLLIGFVVGVPRGDRIGLKDLFGRHGVQTETSGLGLSSSSSLSFSLLGFAQRTFTGSRGLTSGQRIVRVRELATSSVEQIRRGSLFPSEVLQFLELLSGVWPRDGQRLTGILQGRVHETLHSASTVGHIVDHTEGSVDNRASSENVRVTR